MKNDALNTVSQKEKKKPRDYYIDLPNLVAAIFKNGTFSAWKEYHITDSFVLN